MHIAVLQYQADPQQARPALVPLLNRFREVLFKERSSTEFEIHYPPALESELAQLKGWSLKKA